MQILRLFVFVFVISFCSSGIIEAQWTPVGPSGNPIIYSFAECSTGIGGRYIFAGYRYENIYRSSTNGAQWTNINNGLSANERYLSLLTAPDGNEGTNLYVGTDRNRIYRSSDFGDNWSDASLGLHSSNNTNGFHINGLAIIDTILFAGTYFGVYKSTNKGDTWSETGLTRRILAFDTLNSYLLAGTYQYGFQISSNKGTTWTEAGFSNSDVIAIAVIDNNIFISAKDSVFKTTDLGVTWTNTNTILTNEGVSSFTVHENNIFAGTYNYGVILSTDYGVSWTQVNDGLASITTDINSLIISGSFLFVGRDDGGVWRRPLSEMVTSVELINNQFPATFSLKQNYPNPFNPSTKIEFQIPSSAFVELKVFDLLGREIAILANEEMQPGNYETTFDGAGLASGVYFYRIKAGEFVQTRKLLLQK